MEYGKLLEKKTGVERGGKVVHNNICRVLFIALAMAVALSVNSFLSVAAAASYRHIPLGVYDFSSPDGVAHVQEVLLGPLWGPVKRVASGETFITEFRRSGTIQLRERLGPNGAAGRRVEYDEKGREIRGILSEDGGPSSFVYDDAKGTLVWNLCYRGTPPDCLEMVGTTDEKGRIAWLWGYVPTRFDYNEAGQVTTVAYYWYNNNRKEYMYDEAGRLLRKLVYRGKTRSRDEEPPLWQTVDYSYDMQGQLVKVEGFIEKTRKVYDVQGKYDKHGNWTQLLFIERPSGEKQQEYQRVIEYYEDPALSQRGMP